MNSHQVKISHDQFSAVILDYIKGQEKQYEEDSYFDGLFLLGRKAESHNIISLLQSRYGSPTNKEYYTNDDLPTYDQFVYIVSGQNLNCLEKPSESFWWNVSFVLNRMTDNKLLYKFVIAESTYYFTNDFLNKNQKDLRNEIIIGIEGIGSSILYSQKLLMNTLKSLNEIELF